jgi:hypothetical protein
MKLPGCRIGGFGYGVLVAVLAAASSASAMAEDTKLPAPAAQSSRPAALVVFYPDAQIGDGLWPPLFRALRAELARESRIYPLPPDAQMLLLRDAAAGEPASDLVEVRLLGRCDIPHQAWRPLPQDQPLGWVDEVNGRIQPFIFVDCARLIQFLNPATLGMNNTQRMTAVTQAMARVIVHEWLHIELQTAAHTDRGIRRSALTAQDLIGAEPPDSRQ